MHHCTFVQTNSLDKEMNNHWDFNFQPPESFTDAEGNLIFVIKAAALPFELCFSGADEMLWVDGVIFIGKESNLESVRVSIQPGM